MTDPAIELRRIAMAMRDPEPYTQPRSLASPISLQTELPTPYDLRQRLAPTNPPSVVCCAPSSRWASLPRTILTALP